MKSYPRADRIRARILEVISTQLSRYVNDPRLDLVTVTGVELSSDMKIAKVFFTCAGGPKAQKDAMKGFTSAKGFLKRTVAKDLGLKYMPDLRFYHDDSFDYGAKMDRLVKDALDDDTTEDANNDPGDA